MQVLDRPACGPGSSHSEKDTVAQHEKQDMTTETLGQATTVVQEWDCSFISFINRVVSFQMVTAVTQQLTLIQESRFLNMLAEIFKKTTKYMRYNVKKDILYHAPTCGTGTVYPSCIIPHRLSHSNIKLPGVSAAEQ